MEFLGFDHPCSPYPFSHHATFTTSTLNHSPRFSRILHHPFSCPWLAVHGAAFVEGSPYSHYSLNAKVPSSFLCTGPKWHTNHQSLATNMWPCQQQHSSKHPHQNKYAPPTHSEPHKVSQYQYHCCTHNDDYTAILTCIPWCEPGLKVFWPCKHFWPDPTRMSYCSQMLYLRTAPTTSFQYHPYHSRSNSYQYCTTNQHCVDLSPPTTPDKNLLWPP